MRAILIFITALVLCSRSHADESKWYIDLQTSLLEYARFSISDDIVLVADDKGSFQALLIDTSRWQKDAREVLLEDNEISWRDEFGFKIRAKDQSLKKDHATSRRLLIDGKTEIVLNESYFVSADGKAYAFISLSDLKGEKDALKARAVLDSIIGGSSEKEKSAMLEIFGLTMAEAHARGDSTRAQTTGTVVNRSQPDPRCANSGIAPEFQRRIGEEVIPTSRLNLATLPCARGIGNTLVNQVKAVAPMAMAAHMATSLKNWTDSTRRNVMFEFAISNARETSEGVQRFASWYSANRGQILNLVSRAVGGDECMTTSKRTEYLCAAATQLVQAGITGGSGAIVSASRVTKAVASLAKKFRTPKRAPAIVAAAAAVPRTLKQTVGSRFILFDANTGARVSLDTIKPGESFQVGLMPGGKQVALVRNGRRNGGHQYISQRATRNTEFPRYEPTDLPAAGNIRFNRSDSGRWTTEIGGRWHTSDHPGHAQTLANFARDSGVPPTLVTGGRLPGWERPAR